MADEASAVDEVDTTDERYQWPPVLGAIGARSGGPRLPVGGPAVVFAAEPDRPLGSVVPWLGRSFRCAWRIMLPAFLVAAAAELVSWLPVRLVRPWGLPRLEETVAQFGRAALVSVAGALVLHLALAENLGLRSSWARARHRVQVRLGPVVAVASVVALPSVLQTPLFLWSIRNGADTLPFVSIGVSFVRALITVPIMFASLAAVAGPVGVNPFVSSWRLTAGRYWPLAGRQLALTVVITMVSTIAAVAIFYAFSPLLDRFDSGPNSPAFLAFEATHFLVYAALIIVGATATAELYLAAGGAGEI